MIKIAFFDIDGTLVSFKTHEIPESTKEALRRLRQSGVLVYIATGRPYYELPENIMAGFEDFGMFDGYLLMNGQYCYDIDGVFRRVSLDPDDVETLVRMSETTDLDLLVLLEDHNFATGMGPRIKGVADRVNLTYVQDDPRNHPGEEVFQMCGFNDPEDDEKIVSACKNVKTARWTDDFCDIIPADGGKEVGIQAVLDHYGFTRDQAIAFGDGGNDVSMLKFVGTGVAMGNATDEAKAAADFVTDDVDHDGVYKACVELGLIEA